MTENLDKITIEDAIRLKNDLNKATKFDGCTPKEIANLERLNEEQYVTLHAEIAHIKQVWWTIPDWVMVVGSVAAILLAFWVDGFAERIVSILVACYCVAQVKYRQGVYYGFERGYQEGHLQGVHRVLGISKIEWLTYKYMRKLSSEPLDELMGNQPFASRISLLKQLIERIEGMAEQKKLALQLIESANKLAKDRNTIVHNPWQIWIDLEKSDFRTEIKKYSDPNKVFDLSAIKKFTDNAQKTAFELESALNTLAFSFDRLS